MAAPGAGADVAAVHVGNNDEDGTVLAVNCDCFYTDDKGPTANPPGALWRIVAADKVPGDAEVAPPKKK